MNAMWMIQQLVKYPENRRIAILNASNGIYFFEDDIVIKDMIHHWEHIIAITKRKDDEEVEEEK